MRIHNTANKEQETLQIVIWGLGSPIVFLFWVA